MPEGDKLSRRPGVFQPMIFKPAGALFAIAGQTLNDKCQMMDSWIIA